MTFRDWAPLRFIDSALLSQVRSAYVFGKTGQEAFIITKDDEVFGCGPNYSNCLGLGKDQGSQMQPVRIPELCKKNVIGFSFSLYDEGAFVCAYTSDKTLYFWGEYLAGLGTYERPNLSVMSVFNGTVLEVVCGPDHCMILTSNKQVFSFGYNSHGQLGRPGLKHTNPLLIEGNLKGKIVTKISCGTYFSVAVLENGEVFAWGRNADGELGLGDEYPDSDSPSKLAALSNVKIANITCGESYTVAVSNVGKLYVWGKNDIGQLGLGDTTSRFKPTKIEKIADIIDIAATCYGSTTAAISEHNEVYMWGACGEINLTVPTKTPFDSLFDVFAFIANPRIMPRLMTLTFQSDSVGESIKNAFGNSETSDLTIVAEGKEILVHKTILMLRSDYFKVMLQKQWFKEEKNVLIINQNYDGLYAYLQYLYSGKFEGSPEIALESLKIASEYNDVALKKMCENHAKHGITVDNVADLYNLALKLDTKVLAKQCVLFAGKHLEEIIDTPGFSEWDLVTNKQFIRDWCKHKVVFEY